MLLPFSKYSACGNDFILIDNRLSLFPFHDRSFLQELCHRKQGIGADGLVFLENSSKADFKMRIFNCDGSEAEMCGNGIRCLFPYIISLGYFKRNYRIETLSGILEGSFSDHLVKIQMPSPRDMRWNISFSFKDESFILHFIDTGVPHVVFFVEDVEKVDLLKVGPMIRHHELFSPRGVNVNCAEIRSNEEIKIRTFERGVEDETLACGTGATAVALATHMLFDYSKPIRIKTRSNEILEINFQRDQNEFFDISLMGLATFVFEGSINYDMRKNEKDDFCEKKISYQVASKVAI